MHATTEPDPLVARRRARGLAVGAGLLVAVVVALHLTWPTGLVGQVTYAAGTVGAAAVALWTARGMPVEAGHPWRWLAVGLTCSAIGDLCAGLPATLDPPTPGISVSDVGWLVAYGFVLTAVARLLRDRVRGDRAQIDGLIDTAVAVVVSGLVLWQIALQPVLADPTSSASTTLIWSVYPVFDAVVLTLAVRAVMNRRVVGTVGALLVAGPAGWLVADVGRVVVDPTERAFGLLGSGRMVGAGLLGAAIWLAARQPAAVPVPAREPADIPRTPRAMPAYRLVVVVVPLLVPAVLELVAHERKASGSPWTLAIGTALLSGLVLARLVHLLRNREEAERRLISGERYYRALAANSADAVLVLDARGRITNESPHLADLLEFEGDSIRGLLAIEAVCAEDVPVAQSLFDRAAASPTTVFDGELRVRRPDGARPWLALRVVNLLDDPDVQGIVINFHNITDRKVAETELTHLAFHDSLTGLANRGLFHDRVQHALAVAPDAGTAVVYLDLDRFKDVNDCFGHEAGDALLREVGARLLRASRAADTVARLGGDEFAILLERGRDAGADAVAVAERVLRELTVPVMLDAGLVTLSASIGIASGDSGCTASSLMRDADVAMYQAKTAGRGRWVRYEPAMRTATLERLQLEHDLATALDRDELRVMYQPVVDLETSTIVGFEALLRWKHPTLGVVAPDRFVSIAEQSGLIIPIGRWVLETACHMAAHWRRTLPAARDITIAVNISARQLASSDLVSHVEDALSASGLPAQALVLEITESALVEDATSAAGRLRQLRRLGVRLAIDDFGTGYSSLNYLRQFPVDILKIDRSFVSSITGGELPALVHGLVSLGHALHLELVAEGIEEEVQLRELRRARCQLGQGFLFSRPVGAAEAEALMSGALPSRLPLVDVPAAGPDPTARSREALRR